MDIGQQEALLKALGDLPCLVMGCGGATCRRWSGPDGTSMLSVYGPLLDQLPLDGGNTPAIHKLMYRTMASAIRHNTPEAVIDGPLSIDEPVRAALEHKDRSVRLAAG